MTEQEVYVINSLTGQNALFVAKVMAVLPLLIQSVEESGWIKIDEDHQPPADTLVRAWNEAFNQEMVAKYIPRYFLSVEDVPFEGDEDYNEDDDRCYHPEGWYVFADHVAGYTHGLCLDNFTHYKPIASPVFLKGQEGEA